MSPTNKKDSGEFTDLSEVLLHYAKHWKWFILSIIICVSIAFYYLKSQPTIFNTVSNILVKPDETKSPSAGAMALKSLGFGGLSGSESIEDEVLILASHTLMRNMALDLELYKSYKRIKFPFNQTFYNDSPITVDIAGQMIDSLSAPIELDVRFKNGAATVDVKWGKRKLGKFNIEKFPGSIKTNIGEFFFKTSKSVKPSDDYEMEILISPLNGLAESYKNEVDISPASKKANVISLTVLNDNTQRGKDILNKLVELYNTDALKDKNEVTQNTADFIRERIALTAKDLSSIEISIEDYKKKNKFVDIQAEAEFFLKNMGETQQKTVELQIQLSLIKMIEEYLNNPDNKYSLIPSSSGTPENLILSIKEYNSALLERVRLLRNTNEQNPIIGTMDAQIKLLRENVGVSINNVKKEISIALKDWEQKENQIQTRINSMPTQEREYVEKRRRQELMSEIYIILLQKLQEAELTLASNTPKAKIIDAAYTISKPVGPRGIRTLGIGFALGLIIPFIIIWIKGVMKRKLSNIQELEKLTKTPILGEICNEKSDKRIVVTPTSTTAITELFRLVRTNLQFILTQKEEKVILVTSSVSGEGKSFFGLNLAMSLSLIKDKKVVIIGLDIRNPRLSEYLSIKSNRGITTYLSSDDYKPEDIIINLPDLHPNLAVVPAGPIPPNPSELLLSEKLDEFFQYLRQHYDYIIVDTAPVGMVSDTFSLKRISDATIYLFRADYSDISNLKLIDYVTKEEKLKKVYLVMNGTKTKTGYGYGYGTQK